MGTKLSFSCMSADGALRHRITSGAFAFTPEGYGYQFLNERMEKKKPRRFLFIASSRGDVYSLVERKISRSICCGICRVVRIWLPGKSQHDWRSSDENGSFSTGGRYARSGVTAAAVRVGVRNTRGNTPKRLVIKVLNKPAYSTIYPTFLVAHCSVLEVRPGAR